MFIWRLISNFEFIRVLKIFTLSHSSIHFYQLSPAYLMLNNLKGWRVYFVSLWTVKTNYLEEVCLNYSAGAAPSCAGLLTVACRNLPQSASAVTQEFALMLSSVRLHVILFINKALQLSSKINFNYISSECWVSDCCVCLATDPSLSESIGSSFPFRRCSVRPPWIGFLWFSSVITGKGRNIISIRQRPPLWSSGQSSLLQIQRSRVRFQALQDFLRNSGSGMGPLSLVRIIEELLEWKSSGFGQVNRN
jgi:hypothetical protein